MQEIENKQKIQHLLALSQPVSNEVTFFRDMKPISSNLNLSNVRPLKIDIGHVKKQVRKVSSSGVLGREFLAPHRSEKIIHTGDCNYVCRCENCACEKVFLFD